MSFSKFISYIKLIIFIKSAVYFLSRITSPAYGDLLDKQISFFETHQVKFNTDYQIGCSADIPSRVFHYETFSKTSCALLCMGDSSCRGLNYWKEPNTCELFDYVPTRLMVAQNCTYFGPGKIALGLICEISYRCVALIEFIHLFI